MSYLSDQVFIFRYYITQIFISTTFLKKIIPCYIPIIIYKLSNKSILSIKFKPFLQ